MGARTAAAQAEVLAAREGLASEAARLEASARDAMDIRAQVRKAPGKAAAVAGGAAFLALGGPKRVLRRVKRAVRGPEPEFPASMLPREIEAAVRRLGKNGDAVRGTLEREFAAYLSETGERRSSQDVRGALTEAATYLIRHSTKTVGKRWIDRMLSDDTTSRRSAFDELRAAIVGAHERNRGDGGS